MMNRRAMLGALVALPALPLQSFARENMVVNGVTVNEIYDRAPVEWFMDLPWRPLYSDAELDLIKRGDSIREGWWGFRTMYESTRPLYSGSYRLMYAALVSDAGKKFHSGEIRQVGDGGPKERRDVDEALTHLAWAISDPVVSRSLEHNLRDSWLRLQKQWRYAAKEKLIATHLAIAWCRAGIRMDHSQDTSIVWCPGCGYRSDRPYKQAVEDLKASSQQRDGQNAPNLL